MKARKTILVVDDDDTDVFFVQSGLQRAGLSDDLVVARDGQEAIDYLTRSTDSPVPAAAPPIPSLLLLDLKMPRVDGFDVLAWIGTHPELEALPVVVLSNSQEPNDVARARNLGADDYRQKPSNLTSYAELMQEMHARWLA